MSERKEYFYYKSVDDVWNNLLVGLGDQHEQSFRLGGQRGRSSQLGMAFERKWIEKSFSNILRQVVSSN